MNFKEIFNKAFGDISPVSNDDEIFKNVIERMEKMDNKKNFSIKKPIIIGTVSAAMLAFGITGYANDWDYKSVLESIFGEKTEKITDNILDEGVFVQNNIEELDIKLSAAAADKHSAIMILDITSTDGTTLYDELNGIYNFFDKYDVVLTVDSLDSYLPGLGYSMDCIEYDKNNIKLSVRTNTNVDLTGKDVFISVVETENTEQKWVTKLSIDTEVKEVIYNVIREFEAAVINRGNLEELTELQTLDEYEIEYMPAKIDRIKISPLTLYITGKIPAHQYFDFDKNYIITEDGQKVEFCMAGSFDEGENNDLNYNSGYCFGLKEPVDPEAITTVVFSGIEINLK